MIFNRLSFLNLLTLLLQMLKQNLENPSFSRLKKYWLKMIDILQHIQKKDILHYLKKDSPLIVLNQVEDCPRKKILINWLSILVLYRVKKVFTLSKVLKWLWMKNDLSIFFIIDFFYCILRNKKFKNCL